GLLVTLRGEGDRAADLDDHLRDGCPQAGDLLAVLLEICRDVAGLRGPDVKMQDRGSRVVAIDGRVDLLLPSGGQGGVVPLDPDWSDGGRGDDKGIEVLR